MIKLAREVLLIGRITEHREIESDKESISNIFFVNCFCDKFFILFAECYLDFLDFVEPSNVHVNVLNIVDRVNFRLIEHQLNPGHDLIGNIHLLGDVCILSRNIDLEDLLIALVMHHSYMLFRGPYQEAKLVDDLCNGSLFF